MSGLGDVSTILWRERQLLEMLLFKLEEEHLLLASGRVRFLGFATNEVELVLEEIKRTELHRAAEVEAVAQELGIGPSPSLRELADAAPEPWRAVLADHRDAFLTAAQEISSLASSNRDLLSAGHRGVLDALQHVDEAIGSQHYDEYTPAGVTARSSSRPPLLVDEEL